MENLVIGTAGHVDHGKTSLIKALTGINTDTLLDEQIRGISINLGFAWLKLDDDFTVGIVDVPGHERFIKNMLAGVCGINLILLTIASDDGIMPQTREHFEILEFLQLKNIIAVVTKVDLVTRERVEEVKTQIRNEFKIEKIVEFSLYQPETKEQVIRAIKDNLNLNKETEDQIFRLPIDRVFNVKGHGVVVTGSSLSGMVRVGDELEILPTKQIVKVKGIECFNKRQDAAYKHMRVALNLGGVKKEDIDRGKIIATKGVFTTPTKLIDVKITTSKNLDKPLKQLEEVNFYYLANEIKCRVKLFNQKQADANSTVYGQLLLEKDIYASIHDLGVIRRLNPVTTIAGVEIINVFGEYVSKKDDKYQDVLKLYEIREYNPLLERIIDKHPFIKLAEIKEKLHFLGNDEDLLKIINEIGVRFTDNSCLTSNKISEYREKLLKLLSDYHQNHPFEQGMKKEILQQMLDLPTVSNKTFVQFLQLYTEAEMINDRVKLKSFAIKYDKEEQRVIGDIKKYLDLFAFKPPQIAEVIINIKGKNVKSILYSLIKEKELVKLDEEYVLTREKYQDLLNLLDEFYKNKQVLTINDARDILNTSRKYLVLILEYLDKVGYTKRIEEGRVKR